MKYLTIFCGGDIKISVVVVLRTGRSRLRKGLSHLRKGRSQLRSALSQKVFLRKCKPTARDFGKRFGGG